MNARANHQKGEIPPPHTRPFKRRVDIFFKRVKNFLTLVTIRGQTYLGQNRAGVVQQVTAVNRSVTTVDHLFFRK